MCARIFEDGSVVTTCEDSCTSLSYETQANLLLQETQTSWWHWKWEWIAYLMNDKVSNEHEKLTDLGRIRWYEFGGPIRCLISVYEIGGRLYRGWVLRIAFRGFYTSSLLCTMTVHGLIIACAHVYYRILLPWQPVFRWGRPSGSANPGQESTIRVEQPLSCGNACRWCNITMLWNQYERSTSPIGV